MSRSYKHTPIMGWCGTKSKTMRNWRQYEHKAERKQVKQLLQSERYDDLPHPKTYGNEWDSPRDGKQYFYDDHNKACREWCNNNIHCGCHEAYKKYMRK